ncbi:MAG TPA: hypothetical protein VJL87_05490 [Bdellovibrionota bacterium]|nr:hypothetical protein [Bdellovibrionota bacterium]
MSKPVDIHSKEIHKNPYRRITLYSIEQNIYSFYTMMKKKIATNIPVDLIKQAVRLTGLNLTQTLIEGLKVLIAYRKRQDLIELQGKIHIAVNTDKTRQRRKV